MRFCRLGGTAALLAVMSGSAFASSITMHGGKGSIPFYNLNFTITLSSTGTECLASDGQAVPCVFQNETDKTVSQIDLTFQIPTGDTGPFTCAITSDSPFQSCNVSFATVFTSSPGPDGAINEAIFEFYNGSLPNTDEFGLGFTDFAGGSSFGGTAIPDQGSSTVPEPGSAVLLLTALGAAVLVFGRKFCLGR